MLPRFLSPAPREATGGDEVAGVLRVGSNREKLGLILRRGEMSDADAAALLAAAADLGGAVRLGLRHPEPGVRADTAAFVGRAGLLAAGGEALTLIDDADGGVRAKVREALTHLVDRADAVARGEEPGEEDRAAFAAALAGAATGGGRGAGRAAGRLSAAADAGDESLRDALRHPTAGPALARAFATGRHPGTVRVLLDLLSHRHPPAAARAAACRADPAFVLPLLARVLGGGPHALPGLPPLPWLADPAGVLAGVPARLQPAADALAGRACEPAAARRAVREWLLTGGGAPGRRAAEPALRELAAGRRAELLLAATADADPAVAAWAVGLLAAHRVPGWPRRLADLAKHAAPAVRAAAAAALRDAAAKN